MDNSLSKLKIKNIESITIYGANGGVLLKLMPSLDPISVELTLDDTRLRKKDITTRNAADMG